MVAMVYWGWVMPTFAYESMYERTPAGVVEIKSLPERVAIMAEGEGSYWESDNRNFMKLFRFIDKLCLDSSNARKCTNR